ncbi:glycosyltransferase family 4 protein [Acaryochloris sp. IP29b_bin.148]|uniref:glycosyltransferase family 4 protein n=1 Tax=Acaryochloris sp. IP29b_bin.148 TaxID=2969218 RepID=UPI0026191E06|nr:glycosyltransferase family 4 protein [Acaryochloris sp. IP29b_bin.148]
MLNAADNRSIDDSVSRTGTIKLGLIANEFYDLSLGRMGGFGVAIRQVADLFNKNQNLGVEPVFIAGNLSNVSDQTEVVAHGTRLLLLPQDKSKRTQQLKDEKFDIILTMDYRYNYRPIIESLPRVPVVIWVHDPRTPYDMKRIESTRIPGQGDNVPQGLKPVNCTSLSEVVKKSSSLFSKRSILFAQPAAYYEEKVVGTYGVQPPEITFLPNIIEHIIEEPANIVKSERPSVVFLARLDPYKRPWLFAELATYFPNVDFIFMGKNHFQGLGAWEPDSLPSNVKMMGHIDGEEKIQLLSSAWVLVNTSIHEGLAISFLEALMCETPVLSCVDSENVVSRYGIYVGRWDGSGREAVPRFVEGLQRLLDDKDLRNRLASQGKRWVKETHNRSQFIKSFQYLCQQAGVTAKKS